MVIRERNSAEKKSEPSDTYKQRVALISGYMWLAGIAISSCFVAVGARTYIIRYRFL